MATPKPRHWKAIALISSGVLLAGVAPQALAGESAPSAPSASTAALADAPAGYYDAAEGKTGDALKAALHDIISDQEVLSYSEVWDALKRTDEDPSNSSNVVLLYSGKSSPKSNNGGSTGNWNREHVWAKSHGDFGTSPGPGTDIHHLRPTDVQVNSIRGNKDFDNGGDPVEGAPDNSTDGDSFEAADQVKGDVARMIFYMAVRYEGNDSWPDLEVNDKVSNGSAPLHGKLATLKQWHQADPVSDFERKRNDTIFDIQKNRNPFIDNPGWVNEIF